jgi:hypothetical protein
MVDALELKGISTVLESALCKVQARNRRNVNDRTAAG